MKLEYSKKVIFVLTIYAATLFPSNQKSRSLFQQPTAAPVINLVSNSNNVSFSVQINDLLISEKTIANCKYNCLSIQDGEIMMQEGLPQLPMITKLIAVPDCDNILISVSPSNEMYLSNYNILPAPSF